MLVRFFLAFHFSNFFHNFCAAPGSNLLSAFKKFFSSSWVASSRNLLWSFKAFLVSFWLIFTTGSSVASSSSSPSPGSSTFSSSLAAGLFKLLPAGPRPAGLFRNWLAGLFRLEAAGAIVFFPLVPLNTNSSWEWLVCYFFVWVLLEKYFWKKMWFKNICLFWFFMSVHVCSCVFMGVHGCSWVFMGVHGCSWVFMGVHGCSCVFMCVHGCSCVFMCVHVCAHGFSVFFVKQIHLKKMGISNLAF